MPIPNFTRYFASFFCAIALTACQQTHEAKAADLITPELMPINAFTKVKLEIATTKAQREAGLQNRSSLAPDAGMLFIFDPNSTPPCFWMKNTSIPLSVGFINEQGILIQVEDMQPQTINHHCAKLPIKYAVEMNQGWFKQNNVPVGTALFKESKHLSVSGLSPINAFTKVEFEVADTQIKRELGLQNRSNFPPNAAMLFAFDAVAKPCFWMKNTPIPLSIGFINAQGVLVQVEDMAPQTLDHHCAQTPIKYAVEMNQGWFKQNNVPIGTALFKTKLLLPTSGVAFINAFTKAKFEIADTQVERVNGLQDRNSLAPDEGMFYTFDTASKPCFVNNNPKIPLSIGLIDSRGILVQIGEMKPKSPVNYCAQIPIKYAAEMSQGWFERNQVSIGTPLIKVPAP